MQHHKRLCVFLITLFLAMWVVTAVLAQPIITLPVGSASQFLLIDEDTIDNGIKRIERISFKAPHCGNGDPAVCVNDHLANPGVRVPLFTQGKDITPYRGLVLPTGQVGDEGLFRFSKADPQVSLQNGASFTTAEFVTATGAAANENNLDKIAGVQPLSAAEIAGLVGQPVCAVVYDSDISAKASDGYGNLKGATLGVTAFIVTEVTPHQAGGSYLPKITVNLLSMQEVVQICQQMGGEPTPEPTIEPTQEPTQEPTIEPTEEPTVEPTPEPTEEPTEVPTEEPTEEPTPDPDQPYIVVEGQCDSAYNVIVFVITNTGADMQEPLSYRVSDSTGYNIDEGFVYLWTNESMTLTYDAGYGSLTLHIGDDDLVVKTQNCSGPTYDIFPYCLDDAGFAFTITNVGSDMTAPDAYTVTDQNNNLVDAGEVFLLSGEYITLTYPPYYTALTLDIGGGLAVSYLECVLPTETPDPTETPEPTPSPEASVFLLIDEDTIDNGITSIEHISFNAPHCGNGDPAVCVNDHLANPGVRTLLFTQGKDITPYDGLVLPSGQIGDEGLFRFSQPDPQVSLQNGASFTTAEFITATGAAADENNLDKIAGVLPLGAADIAALVGQTVCAVVYDSDISAKVSDGYGNLKGATLGVTAFIVTEVTPHQSGGSYLPEITVNLLSSQDVANVCQQTSTASVGLAASGPLPVPSSSGWLPLPPAPSEPAQ